jgi:hypothetical protein
LFSDVLSQNSLYAANSTSSSELDLAQDNYLINQK